MSAILELEVTDADLAALFDMTTRWVRKCAEDGVIVRTGRNKYRLGDAVPALIAYQTGGDVGEEINKARLRKLNADATRAELELAKERGEVAPVDELKSAMANMCTTIQTNMRRVPQRAVLQLLGCTDEGEFKAKLRAEIDVALTQAAAPENFTEESLANEQDEQDD
ncbi:hypothetical protein [Ralstonia pseudosolanacearum]|uniref:hypothetical protein n=1 Tax=Ralstonia pseudosolanacearum TaxID=1310165 RepID=UPI0026772D66|nr:hypothetical protein [Ralstonia pseudosolanacearum]MDO3528995.1 hypothetical protein [Ralstonia pseudosolanacearum]